MNNYETAMNLLNQHSSSEMTVSEIKQILSENNFSENETNAVFGQLRREKRNFKRGIFNVKFDYEPLETEPVLEMTETILTKEQTIHEVHASESLVPKLDPTYVQHGCFDIVEKVITSGVFAPIWISGLSGNGKTFGVEQACAKANRELIICNISNETDESDLIGDYTLEATKFFEIDMSVEDYQAWEEYKKSQKIA